MKKLSEIRSFISDVFEKYQQTTFPEKLQNIVVNGERVTLDIDALLSRSKMLRKC